MSKSRKALLTLLALALLKAPVDHLLTAMLPDASVNAGPQLIAGMIVSWLLLGLPAWLLRPWTSPRLTKSASRWQWLLLGGAAAVLTRAAMLPVDTAWQGLIGMTPAPLPVPDWAAALYIVPLAVIPAFTEEAFFRGALLTSLLDGGRRVTAVTLTMLTFALMHGNAANLPSLLAVSLLLTLLMLRTGRVAVPMTAHFIYNLTGLGRTVLPLWANLLCGAALVGLTAYLCVRQPKYAHPPMKRADGLIAAAALAVLAALYFI